LPLSDVPKDFRLVMNNCKEYKLLTRASLRGSAVAGSWFGILYIHRHLDFHFSSLKIIQSLFQVSHFLLDLTQFYPVLAAGQAFRAKLLNDILLKLTSQYSEIRITPNLPISVLQFAGSNALNK